MGHSVFPPVFTFFGVGLLNQLLPAPQIPAIFLLFCPDLLLWSNPHYVSSPQSSRYAEIQAKSVCTAITQQVKRSFGHGCSLGWPT